MADYTDPFDGTGALSANWTTAVNAPTRNSGVAIGVFDVFAHAWYTGGAFADDQYATVVLQDMAASTKYISATVRSSATGTVSCYYVYTDGATGSGHSAIGKTISNTNTDLQNLAVTFSLGDVLKLEVVGSTLKAYKALAASPTSFSQIGTDQATGGQLTSGSAGFNFYSAGSIASWAGGDMAAASNTPVTPSIGAATLTGIAGYLGSGIVTSIGSATLTGIAGYLGTGIRPSGVIRGAS